MKRLWLCLVGLIVLGGGGGCSAPQRDDVSPRIAKKIVPPPAQALTSEAWDVAPRLLSGDQPVYPISRVLSREAGSATLEFVIDENGRPTNIRVLAATYKFFGSHAVIAVRTWRYAPAMKTGKPVPARVVQTFHFQIK